jgi:hypothetical protein
MSFLSDFLGGKSARLPKVKPAEEIGDPDEFDFGIDAFLREMERKSGFTDTIITGGKKPKLGLQSLLGNAKMIV